MPGVIVDEGSMNQQLRLIAVLIWGAQHLGQHENTSMCGKEYRDERWESERTSGFVAGG